MPRPAELHAALLPWFAREARDLPWRRTRDPYAIWVSETMLQQTRVEAVIGHFHRFLARFPTVAALAGADEDEVLGLWSGLGYYRRARALHAAAREIVERHGGEFPRTPADARALPGVGPYTAGAVLSIAYGVAAAAVDGNVARVFARWFALEAPVGSPALRRVLWSRAEEMVPDADPGAWNQALMELGARVCTPRNPACDACPVSALCAARAAGRARDLPVPARRRGAVDVLLEVALVERGGEILLEQRPAGGRMAGLWELPTRELPSGAGGLSGLWPAEYRGDRSNRGDGPNDGRSAYLSLGEPLGEIAHAITHHRIRARVRAARIVPGSVAERSSAADSDAGSARGSGERRFVPARAAGELGLTGMARKILARFPAGVDTELRPASRRR